MISKIFVKFDSLLGRFRSYFVWLYSGCKFKSVGRFCKIRGKGMSVAPGVTIGDFCWIESVDHYNSGNYIQKFDPIIVLGESVALSCLVHISAVQNIHICTGTLIGSKVYIGDHSHGSYVHEKWASMAQISPRFRPLDDIAAIYIGENCWIGDGAVILAGTKIGNNCVIGANSVVKGVFGDNCIIAGVPANIIKEMNQ